MDRDIMKVDKKVLKELNSFENSELTRVLDGLEDRELYASGLHRLSGGYASCLAFDIAKEADIIEIELESGLCGANASSDKVYGMIPISIIGNKILTLKEKLGKVEF